MTGTETSALEGIRQVLRRTFIYQDSSITHKAVRLRLMGDLATARALSEQALGRDPSFAYRWSDMGEVLLALNRQEQAKYCFRRAASLGPNCPPVLIRAVRAMIRLGIPEEALPLSAHTLNLTDYYDGEIFGLYDHLTVPAATISEKGVPPESRAAAAYFRHLIERGDADGIEAEWSSISSRGLADDTLTNDYVNHLLKRRQYSAASAIWRKQLRSRSSPSAPGNLLINGDFEFPPSGGTLDWKFGLSKGASVVRDTAVAHSGSASLRIQFDGTENLEFHDVSQTVVVAPGRYVFQAYVRAQEVSTDQGVGFRIFDVESPSRLDATTQKVTGTGDWKKIEKAFVVPASTAMISVQVVREPSARFFGKIRGTVWVDSVSVCSDRQGEHTGQ